MAFFFRLYCSFTLCAVLSNHSGSSVARKNFFLFCNGILFFLLHTQRGALTFVFSFSRFTFHAWTTLYSFLIFPFFVSRFIFRQGREGLFPVWRELLGTSLTVRSFRRKVRFKIEFFNSILRLPVRVRGFVVDISKYPLARVFKHVVEIDGLHRA